MRIIKFIKNLIENISLYIRRKDDDVVTITKVVNEETIIYTITVIRNKS